LFGHHEMWFDECNFEEGLSLNNQHVIDVEDIINNAEEANMYKY